MTKEVPEMGTIDGLGPDASMSRAGMVRDSIAAKSEWSGHLRSIADLEGHVDRDEAEGLARRVADARLRGDEAAAVTARRMLNVVLDEAAQSAASTGLRGLLT